MDEESQITISVQDDPSLSVYFILNLFVQSFIINNLWILNKSSNIKLIHKLIISVKSTLKPHISVGHYGNYEDFNFS